MIYSEIRRVLKDKQLSIDWLAKQVGMKPSTLYSRFSKDSDKIDMVLVTRICDILCLPIERFIGDIGKSMMQPNLEEWELLKKWRVLSGRDKTLIAELTDRLAGE